MNRQLKNLTKNQRIDQAGFTLLELLVVVAIMATLSVFATPVFQDWGTKRSFDSSVKEIASALKKARNESGSRDLTVRVLTSRSDDTYTITSYTLDSNLASCDTSLNWTQLEQKTINMNSNYLITGSGVGNICFYRDGSSSGGNFSINPKATGSTLEKVDISVILATGFVDVIK